MSRVFIDRYNLYTWNTRRIIVIIILLIFVRSRENESCALCERLITFPSDKEPSLEDVILSRYIIL